MFKRKKNKNRGSLRSEPHLFNGPVMPANAARRTLISGLIVMCMPIVICLMVYAMYSSHTMEREIYRNMQMTVKQGKNNIDHRFEQVEKNAMAILNTVNPYLNSKVDLAQQLEEYGEMMRVFTEYQNQNMITKLRLYVSPDKIYSNQSDTFYSLDSLDWVDLNIGLGTQWQETHPILLQFGYPGVSVISCVSSISSLARYDQLVGVMFLDLDVTQFNEMLSAGIEEGEALFVVGASGEVLLHPDATMQGKYPFEDADFSDIVAGESGSANIVMGGEEHMMVYAQLDSTDWYLMMTVPAQSVYSSGIYSLDIVRLIILLVIFVTLILALISTYNIVVRNTVLRINMAIGNTIDTMKKDGLEPIEKEDSEGGAPSNRKTLAALEHNTNLMAATITRLLESQYQDQIAVRDFQMQALQAQINPHFLYNTLDVIKWMIADGQNEDSVWMVNALSRYFQLSLSCGRDIVHIGEEILLTRTYIGIMQRRFKDVFTADFSVEAEAEHCLIPKLSLQPIIENALLHGILYAEKPEKTICVRVMYEGDQIVIDVEDNGSGIDEESLESIRHIGGDSQGKSYGLSNVIRRMQLFGAGTDGFEINSRKGVGTCVSLRFPVHREEEDKTGE